MNADAWRRVEALSRTGRSAEDIATILASEGHRRGVSRASVGRALREILGARKAPRWDAGQRRSAAPRPAVPPQPAGSAPATPPRRAALVAALHAATEWRAVAAATLALLRHDDPFLDRELTLAEESVVGALFVTGLDRLRGDGVRKD